MTQPPKTPHSPQRRRLLRRAIVMLTGMVAVAFAAGFGWFAHEALRPQRTASTAPTADGLVVLTGGAGRIETALQLLMADKAPMLLISGVTPGIGLQTLVPPSLGLNRTALARLAPRITLGHTATSTIGNARETAAWARMNDLHSLVVITASYHMQRALSEIGTALPDVRLRGWAVSPPALARPLAAHGWWLLLKEYVKWFMVTAGMTGGAHLREMS